MSNKTPPPIFFRSRFGNYYIYYVEFIQVYLIIISVSLKIFGAYNFLFWNPLLHMFAYFKVLYCILLLYFSIFSCIFLQFLLHKIQSLKYLWERLDIYFVRRVQAHLQKFILNLRSNLFLIIINVNFWIWAHCPTYILSLDHKQYFFSF